MHAELAVGSVVAVPDKFPVTSEHYLVIPKRHTEDYFSMTNEEKQSADCLLTSLKQKIIQADPLVLGFNIGMNCGIVAGQTILHAHIHLIPRREGDTPDPTGGVRCVILDKKNYLLGNVENS